MKFIFPIGTILGSLIGATYGGYVFFYEFTEKTNWQKVSGGQTPRIAISTTESAKTSLLWAGLGVGTGLLIDLTVLNLLATYQTKRVRSELIKLRESTSLGQAEKEAIDLTLANLHMMQK